MLNHQTKNIGFILTTIVFLALSVCRMPAAFAAEPVAAGVVRPKAALWKPVFSGDTSRIPGDLKGLADASVGSVTVQDLGYGNGDEIIVGSGFDQEPAVSVYRGDGSLILSFPVYDPGMKQGVNVAAGDVDGDGQAEIITGTRPGAAPHVLIFDGQGRPRVIAGGFFPFDREFRGGVSVAAGDVDGDGQAEIITAAGPGGQPRVRVWKRPFLSPVADFMAFGTKLVTGVNVAAGDVDGDGSEEILAAPSGRGEPLVRIFKAADPGAPVGEFKIVDDLIAGLNMASADLDGDGLAEIIVAPNGPGLERVSVFDRAGQLRTSFQAGKAPYIGGSLVAVGRFSAAAGDLILTLPADRDVAVRPTESKFITVNITEQRLRAYEYGREVKTFLVSTGTVQFPTPIGNFSVLVKKPNVLYRWFYGPGNPDNYDLGLTPWNLMIVPHIYIHYAPWHNNFGRRVSHGCINVNLANIKWIYNWSEIGAPVDVTE